MKRNLRIKISIALVSCLAFMISGCSSNGSDKPPAASTSPAASGAKDSADTSPFGKYTNPIELTTGVATSPAAKWPEGDSVENNIYTRSYKEELGINVKVLWTAQGEQYDQKMKLAVASNDLPDVMAVNVQQLAQLAIHAPAGAPQNYENILYYSYGWRGRSVNYGAASPTVSLTPTTLVHHELSLPREARRVD